MKIKCGACLQTFETEGPVLGHCPICGQLLRNCFTIIKPEGDQVEINGVTVTVYQSNPDKWLAGWIGSDNKPVTIIRHTREAVIADAATFMRLRAKVFNVRY